MILFIYFCRSYEPKLMFMKENNSNFSLGCRSPFSEYTSYIVNLKILGLSNKRSIKVC